jgi:hypothetical protein
MEIAASARGESVHGRRRESRFIASPPWPAALLIVEDVMLERFVDESAWVVAKAPPQVGEDLTLDVLAGAVQLDVTVVASEPLIVNGRVEHRLHLRISSEPVGGGSDDAGNAEAADGD